MVSLIKNPPLILTKIICFVALCICVICYSPLISHAAIQEYTLSEHTNYIRSIDISVDGRYIVSAGEDCVAKVWDLSNGSLVRTLTTYTEIDSKNHTRTIQGHKKKILSVAFSQDGKFIASAGDDNQIKIWETDTGKITYNIPCSYWGFGVKFSPDGNWLASAFDNLSIWDLKKGEYDGCTLGVTKIPFAIAFSNDGKIVAAGNWFGKVQLWKNKNGGRPELRTLSQNKKWNSVSEIAFSPDDKLLVAGSENYPDKASENLKLWEVDTGRLVWSVVGDYKGLNSITFSPDGKNIATLGSSVKVWDISGNLLKEIQLQPITPQKYRSIEKIRMLCDGKIIACRTEHNIIKVSVINPE